VPLIGRQAVVEDDDATWIQAGQGVAYIQVDLVLLMHPVNENHVESVCVPPKELIGGHMKLNASDVSCGIDPAFASTGDVGKVFINVVDA
jgi:hypothetical protein